MSTGKKLALVPGAEVQLSRDLHTRGGVRFRSGLVMTIRSVERELLLEVRVRGRLHHISMTKKDAALKVLILSNPQSKED